MPPDRSSIYRGACDTSAAVRIAGTNMFIAATDEDSVLRVYDLNASGGPLASADMTAFMQTAPKEEADLEGAAQVGDLVFWITSHGLTSKAKTEESRRRLFATSIAVNGRVADIRPEGKPYTNLLRDLLRAEALSGLGLDVGSTLAPEEEGGLNIEGLAPAGDSHLLIGFRNPIPGGNAIVARLHNPLALIRGEADAAQLSLAGCLDLGGRGLRAMEFLPDVGMYLLIGGAFNDVRNFRLFVWSGGPDAPVALDVPSLDELNPEELLVTPKGDGRYDVHLFSDDGDAMVSGTKCKKLEDRNLRSCRMHSVMVQLPATHAS